MSESDIAGLMKLAETRAAELKKIEEALGSTWSGPWEGSLGDVARQEILFLRRERERLVEWLHGLSEDLGLMATKATNVAMSEHDLKRLLAKPPSQL